jgi:hypothetical protein
MNRKGITLVLVLLILTALILLGIPFATSMLFKEKTSKDTLNVTQSRIAALGARNSAINLLLRTHDLYELQMYPAPFNTPDYDTIAEMETNLSQLNILNTANPKGIIWSSDAEDEQGKINILTAPRRLVEYLSTLIKPNEDIQHFITEYSYRSTPWIGSQNLAGYRRYLAVDGNEYDIIYVDNPVPCGSEEGLRVRLHQGEREVIAYVAKEPCPECPWASPPRNPMQQIPDKINGVIGYHNGWVSSYDDPIIWRTFGTYQIWLDRTVTGISLTETTTVEIEQPHPVNINTASKEVLLALFTGVGSNDAITNTTISQAEAQLLVEEIKKAPLSGPPDLEEVISNTLSSDQRGQTQKRQLWLNSFYPRDATSELANIVERHYTGTMPFCYRSFDIYTLNSTGIVNYPSGNQASVTTLNEIVDIAPVSDTLTWSIESQYDFDKEFYTYLGNPLKITTYPYLTNLGGWDDTMASRNPDYSRDFNVGALKLKTASDGRGKNIFGSTSSFSDTYDGVLTPQDYNRNSVVRFIADDTPNDIYSGGVEFWIKFNSIPVSANLFDIKQQDYENRLALLYENGELILSVCDATVDRKASQIRTTVNFEVNVWYHIGAYWKGTKYAQLALFVDGRPVGSFGHYDDTGQKILTQLNANVPDVNGMDIAQNEMTIPVISTAGFPDAGVIEIGSEAIDYISKTGNGFVVQTIWDVLTPTQLAFSGRGRRNTSIISHTTGAKVTIYGYFTPFTPTINIINYPIINLNPLPIGGAFLLDTIPEKIPDMNIDVFGGISPSTIAITVSCDAINNVPPQGYIKIDDEIIFYENIDDLTFNNCTRGALGTTPAGHNNGRPVRIFSLRVSDTANYPATTLIQIDDEWFGPFQKSPDRPDFFTGALNGTTPLELWRGYVSSPITHYTNAGIIPVLAPANIIVGKNDVVTIIESDQTSNPKEQKTIRNAVTRNQEPVFLFTGNSPGFYSSLGTKTSNLFAFTDNLARSYNIDNITRMLKFPSDELPSYLPGTFTIGANISATVDEIKFYSSPRGNYAIAETIMATDSSRTTVQFNAPSLDNSGIIKIGDEYIGYGSINGTTLGNCVRGYLNTPIQTHDFGQRAINMTAFLPVTSLNQSISAERPDIPVNSTSGFANSGYVLIGNDFNSGEVAGYISNLRMPAHSNGVFRGMFGTTKQAHPMNTLCYGLPFRYWDLQKPNAFDSQMAYFQAAHLARGATWKRISWEETHLPNNDNQVRLRFIVRFNTQPAWNTTPTNQPGGIFEFTDPNGFNDINVKADQIEIIVFFQYLPGAFLSNAWKRSPLLENIYVEYQKPVITVSRQEK